MRRVLALACLLGACAAQGPADDQVEDQDHTRQLLEIEVRVQAAQLKALQEQNALLEERLSLLEASAKAPLVKGLLSDPIDGTVVPRLGSEQTIECARALLSGIATAQLGYDAAFDSFNPDFASLGWSPSRTDGCIQHLAVWVDITENHKGRAVDFRAWALILEGEGRGRTWSLAADGGVRPEPTMDEAGIARVLTREGALTRAPSAAPPSNP